MSKRAEEAALKAYPVHPMTISPQEGKHGEILNFDEWLDDFRIGIQSLSANAGFRQGYEQAEKDILDDAKQVVASFEQAFKQAEKDIIERVIEWVKRNGYLYVNRVKEGDEYVGEFMEEPFVENLRKAMEEEV